MWKQPLQSAISIYFRSLIPISLAVLPFAFLESFLLTYLNNYIFLYDPESLASLRTDSLIAQFFTPFWTLGVLYVAHCKTNGEQYSFLQGARFVFRKFFPLLGALIVTGLLIVLGLIALFIPGLYLAGKYFLIAPVVAFDDAHLISTRDRSGILMDGRKLSSVIIVLLLFLIWGLSFFAAYFALYYFAPEVSIWIDALLEALFALPFAFITVFVFAVYHSARTAHEPVEQN